MAGRCSVWPTTAHPSTFSHHRALCTLTSTCTSGAAVNAKKEILHVYREKDLPKMFWIEGSVHRKSFLCTRLVECSSEPRQDISSLSEKQWNASATGDVKYESKKWSVESEKSISRLMQPIFEHMHPIIPTLLQDSQDCHSCQPMNLIQHTDVSRL